MDEGKNRAAILLTKESVVARETFAELVYFVDETVPLLVVVMEVNLDVADAKARNLRDSLNDIVSILLLGVKEGVLWALTSRVTRRIFGNPWPSILPATNTGQRSFESRAHTKRFVVIGDRYPRPLRFWASDLPQAVSEVWYKPDFCVFREVHRGVCSLSAAIVRKWDRIESPKLKYRALFPACQRWKVQRAFQAGARIFLANNR
jgi:hypothetical protein